MKFTQEETNGLMDEAYERGYLKGRIEQLDANLDVIERFSVGMDTELRMWKSKLREQEVEI